MNHRFALFATGCLLSAALSAQSSSTPTKTELEGRWEGAYSITQGRPQFKLAPGLVWLNFSGQKLTALHLLPAPNGPTPDPAELSFSLDTKATPKQIDYWQSFCQRNLAPL
jgi:hypothetical protein